MRTAAFSIVSPNYRHYARVLMASLQRHHPEWDRFVLLVGGDAGSVREESFTTVSLDALPLPHPRQFCFRYTILELNTAVKPWMFEHVFALGYERVVYLDPDIFVFSPLAELDAAPVETFLTLTPHLTGFIRGDDHPSERSILQAGTYNLGFLAVSRRPQLAQFLGWWREKLEFQCVVDTANGLFVDQKWMDLVPGLFSGVAILRHDGYNVAYWNLGQRTVTARGNELTVNGQPLRFFHFSGFDPAVPEMASKHDERLKRTEAGDAARLLEEYGLALRAAGYASCRSAPYAFAVFADGTPLPDAVRVAYRNSPSLQSTGGADPFAHAELFAGLFAGLNAALHKDRRPSQLRKKAGTVSYRILSRARPLVRLIPRAWRTAMRESLLGRKEAPPRGLSVPTSLPPGLNVVGYIARDTGVGESARLCKRSCDAAELESHLIDVDATSELARQAIYRASIYHVNADQLPEVHDQLRPLFEASAYNIGCWHWELPELPDAWMASADPLQEIWAPSAFVQSAISRKVTIPVVHMPHGVAVTDIEACSPEELGVPPGRFTFLFMFDLDSVMERKNPLAAVEAFRRAFPRPGSAALLIKAGRAESHRQEYAALEEALQGLPDVYLSPRMLPRPRVNGLLAACDGVVSLHRSEGFGLILAEAMALGKPVVATGWSGNMDFMNSGNSCPVGYELVTLDRTYRSYPAGEQWAEPDVDHAAHLMKRVVEDSAFRTQIGERARHTIRSRFSPEAAGRRSRRRLAFLGLMNRQSPMLA
jgi:glycosyltransferase involved in cell wall biosynthesis